MHNRIVIGIILFGSLCLWSCKHEHAHDNAHGHPHEEGGIEPLAFTLYSDKTELFVEFKPLVVGDVSKFAAHFTALGETFLPLTEGQITVSLIMGEDGIRATANEPSSPGIFRLALQPKKAGKGKIVFDIKTKDFTDRINIENVTVYPDEASASKAPTIEDGGDITYLKEQAWKVDFANTEIKKESFYKVVRANGQILPAPNSQATVSAQVSGVLTFSNNRLVKGLSVGRGTSLFYIKTNETVQSGLNTAVQQAQATVVNAKKNLDRASILVKDKIISQKEYLKAKEQYDIAQAQLQNASVDKSYNQRNQRVSSPISGFVQDIFVENGQTVTIGTPLATVSSNNQLVLEVKVPQSEISSLPHIQSANFSLQNSDKIYNTKKLNGKVISYGKSIINGSPYVPLTFQIDNTEGVLAGSATEVFLESTEIPNTIILPVSSLIEEQGKYYVYVQTGGESFEKREVELGGSNGKDIQILKGLNEEERVVTKGAYQIKLSTASGALPAHGHEH